MKMSDLFFEWVNILGEKRLLCFKRGELATPIFILDKYDVIQLRKELEEEQSSGEFAK